MIIIQGAGAVVAAKFRNRKGQLFDPDTVTFVVKPPTAPEFSLVFGVDAGVVKVATGDYEATITGDASGVWKVDALGALGSAPPGIGGGSFVVAPRGA